MLPVVGELRPWTDPEVVSIGRLPMRIPTTAFPDVTAARAGDRAASPWWRSLDGRWRFRLWDHPDAVPAGALTGATTGRGWTTLDVPGNWTVQGVGDLPQYTNVQMPFDGPPPALPERNPTGVYRRAFDVPRSWGGRRVVLHVGAADSVHAVYVNGAFAGYGTDNRLASEYDVTALVRPGRNELAVAVVRWSAHSYVEDQDQWWMAGLHREVFVEARAPVHVVSLRCDAGYRVEDGTGTLDVAATIGPAPGPGWTVRTWVETLRGRRVTARTVAPVPHEFATPYLFTGHTARASFELPEVVAWSAETPERHRVVAELVDPDGTTVEVHAQVVGFRDVRVRDGALLVNGERVWVFGVNRHDHHPDRGKAVTVDDMRDDLLAMRRMNITAVRCSHYPNDPRFLDLCDELGMYVIDESNIESHAYNTTLCDDPRWRSAWVSRGARMVERDRNHPCVIAWSLGNESGYGTNHDALAGWIRRADPSRPLHYEGAVFHDGWDDGGRPATDLVCPMYPPHDAVAAYRGDRPFVMCEYSHAMGNSNGNLADYWDLILAGDRLQGGFIWEWKDHGIRTRLPNGKRGFAYGGQFGERPHDGNFVADGLMSSDLVAHPAVQEVTWVYRPVAVTGTRRRLRIENRRSFADLADLTATWELVSPEGTLAAGALDVPAIAPGASASVPVPCDVPSDDDVRLTVRWSQRRATPWAPAGHLVAWDQVELRAPRRRRSAWSVVRDGDVAALLASPVEPCIFRAPVDNDGFKLMPELTRRIRVGGRALAAWQDEGVDVRPASELVEHHHVVDVAEDGSQFHEHRIVVPDHLADLGRVGVTFRLRPGFTRMRWFGRGPLENYPDRNRGAVLGTWDAPLDEPPYLVPQEFGLRTDCRWFELVDPTSGRALRIEVIDPVALHVSATHFTDQDLYQARHETDLRPRRETIVHVDVAHRGLGTASCGPDTLPAYKVPTGEHRFTYRLVRLR